MLFDSRDLTPSARDEQTVDNSSLTICDTTLEIVSYQYHIGLMGNLSRRYVKAGKVPQAGRGIRSHKRPQPAVEPLKGCPTDACEVGEIRRGRPRLERKSQTREALKPWEAAGMSRATFYRRLREARAGLA